MTTAHVQDFSKVLYWDDVAVDDDLPGFSMALDWTTMVRQVHGSQDWSRIHHDPDYAVDSGHKGIFYNTGWTAGMLSRAVTDWMGLEGWVKKFSFQMRDMNMNGDTVSAKGKVVDKFVTDDGEHLVKLDVWLENNRVGKTTPAEYTVRLPVRG